MFYISDFKGRYRLSEPYLLRQVVLQLCPFFGFDFETTINALKEDLMHCAGSYGVNKSM